MRTAPLALLLCSSVSQFAIAQDEAIETLEITATRVPANRSDIAAPVTILTANDLQNRGIFRVADALDTVPGLQVQRGGSLGGQTQLRLRGAEANQTLILIDGIEANDPAAGDEVQLENLLIADIERIEIIRGPQSVAWGSDALAGVINVVTKKQKEAFSSSVFAEGGSFGTFRGGGSLGAAGDGWHLRGGLTYQDSTGINVSRVGGEDDSFRNVTFNIKGGLKLSDEIDFEASVRHSDGRNEFDGIDFTTGLPADSDNVSNTRNTYVAAGFVGNFLDGAYRQSLRATYLDTEIANLASGVASGTTAAERFGFYADAQFTPLTGQKITLLIDHEETDFAQEGAASPFGDPNQNQELSVTGFGADYTGTWFENFTASASVRYDDSDRFDDIVTWRFGGAYTFEQTGTRFYASIGRGQKDPTFIELFGFFADQFQGNPNLDPERSINREIGWEQAWLEGKINTRVSYFSADLEDEINGFVFDPTTFLFTAENVVGQSERKGIEVEASWQVSETLNLTTSYAYLDAEEPDAEGNLIREIRRPEHTAFAALNWQANEQLSLNISGNYRSSAIDLFFPPFPNPSERVTLDSYLLVNIGARYRVNEWLEINGRIENLTDENYEDIFGFNTPGIGAFGGVRLRY